MAQEHDDRHFFSTLEDEALICARCGSCRLECPVYRVIGWESATPRGKIGMAKDIWVKNGKMDDDFIKRIDQCTLCGACANLCATNIDTRSLYLEIRRRIAEEGRAPEAFQKLRNNLVENKNVSTFPNEDRLEWSQDLDDEPDDLELKAGADVVYFVGCVSSFYPQSEQVPLSIVQILMAADIDFTVMGGEEWCCGFPLVSAGFAKDKDPFIKHNVGKVKELGIHTLIASCPSCYHFWKHECTEELGDYDLEIMHTTQYMAKLIQEGKLELNELNEVVTYHDPCDLGRNSKVFDAPREVIQSIPGVKFVELAHNRNDSICCGGGGNLQSSDPTLASDITDLRLKEIEDSGANIVVSACQQCEQMLASAVRKKGLPIRVMDISELVVESMEA